MAATQHGVVSVAQLQELGYVEGSVAKAVRAGRLHRLHRGVFAVGHTDLSLHGRCLAAVLGCGPGALLSHWSAAWLWGLLPTQPIPIHVTTPLPRKGRPGLRIHRSRTFTEEDGRLQGKIPVTSVARTALDLAARARARSLERLLQRSEKLELFDLPEFESVLARNRGHRGAAPLRRAIALYKPPPFTRSGLEERFLELLEENGFPKPASNYVEAGYELDVYWPELRFAVELDVYETHGTRLSFEEDRLRQEELKLAGVEMIRVTGLRLSREPERVLERLRRLLSMRASA
ncbi:MAG TPA: type IV toxin-antitoxin system AbiEi family antitoxin domain-containing protein [Solirubrobacterales bacterium]|nr:type IV toxin-antitoxin system AbiEi family antitoxin domain-containing protein [Solirubrobacterales bacterium]